MPTFVTRDGMTIEINPIPKGKLGVRKRPEGGVLQCQRCGREEAVRPSTLYRSLPAVRAGCPAHLRRKPSDPQSAIPS
jgi:hypothetical protein